MNNPTMILKTSDTDLFLGNLTLLTITVMTDKGEAIDAANCNRKVREGVIILKRFFNDSLCNDLLIESIESDIGVATQPIMNKISANFKYLRASSSSL